MHTGRETRFYYFMNDKDIITNLESGYMDTLHFSPDVNKLICESLINDDEKYRVHEDDTDKVIEDMRTLAYEITDTLMDPYIPMIKEQIE